jgi:hypothetical protein
MLHKMPLITIRLNIIPNSRYNKLFPVLMAAIPTPIDIQKKYLPSRVNLSCTGIRHFRDLVLVAVLGDALDDGVDDSWAIVVIESLVLFDKEWIEADGWTRYDRTAMNDHAAMNGLGRMDGHDMTTRP